MNLQDFRRWAAGEAVDGLPENKPKVAKPISLDRDELLKAVFRNRGEYTVSSDGTDAKLHFGKHKDLSLSDIVQKDRSYVSWMLNKDYSEELKDICRIQLGKTNWK